MFLSKLHWFILGLLAAPSPSSQLLRLRLEVDKEPRVVLVVFTCRHPRASQSSIHVISVHVISKYGIAYKYIPTIHVLYCVFGGSKKTVSLTSPTTFQSGTILSGMVIRRPIRVYSNTGPELAAKRPTVSSSRRRRSPRRPRPSRLLSPTQPTLSTAHLRPRALTHIRQVGIPPPAPAAPSAGFVGC